jgi:hypothetical protein
MRGGFPLSLRLIREMHAILLKSGRGATKQPGEFRRSQNWIAKTGVVREITGRQRGRIYAYSDYLALLDRGTDPLPA